MSRMLLTLGLAALGTTAAGCMTSDDLAFLGMGLRPAATEVVQTREPLVLEVERPKGEAAPQDEVRVPVPKRAPFGYAGRDARMGLATPRDRGLFHRPWRRPTHFGLPMGSPEDARWTVRGAGRGGFGIPDEPAPRLTFGADNPPVKATPAKPEKPTAGPKPNDR